MVDAFEVKTKCGRVYKVRVAEEHDHWFVEHDAGCFRLTGTRAQLSHRIRATMRRLGQVPLTGHC
jgi:hypothetical protein